MTDNEKNQIRTDYLKTWISTALAIIAGEVTLITTVYKISEWNLILYFSIFFFMFVVIFFLAAYEGIVNKSTGIPIFQNQLLLTWIKVLPKTDKSVWMLSGIGGILIGFGLAFLAFFLYKTVS